MRKLLLLFTILAAGVANAQVSNSTGQLTGSSYGVSELRSKIEKGGDVVVNVVKGSPYLHETTTKAYIKSYEKNPVMVKFNMSSGEFETADGRAITPIKGDEMRTKDGGWHYIDGMWLLDITGIDGSHGVGLHYVHFTAEYEEAVPAANPKVRDIPAKWHLHTDFYKSTPYDGIKRLSRKEAKPFKKLFKLKPLKRTTEYKHTPHTFKQRGFGNTNHNAPGHVCDETCH